MNAIIETGRVSAAQLLVFGLLAFGTGYAVSHNTTSTLPTISASTTAPQADTVLTQRGNRVADPTVRIDTNGSVNEATPTTARHGRINDSWLTNQAAATDNPGRDNMTGGARPGQKR